MQMFLDAGVIAPHVFCSLLFSAFELMGVFMGLCTCKPDV